MLQKWWGKKKKKHLEVNFLDEVVSFHRWGGLRLQTLDD